MNQDNFQIVIVGGFPRAGTRQFTDIFNNHPEICIKGECWPKSFKMLANTFAQADIDHKGKRTENKYFGERIYSALNAYAFISKGTNKPFNFTNKKFLGFKKPRIEIHLNSIDKLFGNHSKIIFFYCIRNLRDNFLSENSMFNISAERFVERTQKSLDALNEIMRRPNYNFHIISLDEFIQSEDKGSWLSDNLFSKLPINNLNALNCQNYLVNTSNRNATIAKGKHRKTTLSEEFSQFFNKNLSFKKKAQEFERKTGKMIWNL